MENSKFNVKEYLERIDYNGELEVNAKLLHDLHVGHVTHIPFENLDQLQGKTISLDRDDLFEKIVLNKRGGYCFEMNGLFSHVLKEVGFQVSDVFARVYRPGFGYSGRSHQVIIVEIDGEQWMADVGFGGNGPIAPVKLVEGVDQEQFGRFYRIKTDPLYEYVMEFKAGDEYETVYSFTSEPCHAMDYDIANWFTSTHPNSIFRKVIMCTMPTEKGRVSIFDNNLKIIQNGLVTEKTMNSDFEINNVLEKYYGITLQDDYLEKASSR
ncbi:arylamine N-acetyltransferase [Alkalibacter rhizosphaerae]|uniref:Arylamine N-acetyltransferase n=1 Tax=Alkalibacter rhizosphaerae TaxID=2815577 RepID=A0A974XP28_9FIRM|nr:arylamine N-acetyltransferase [Alkalibacter rhizosphaerae]QSX09406.1 arylamine N-acetyltransferase [Alkalibacter rhizosphaerae]